MRASSVVILPFGFIIIAFVIPYVLTLSNNAARIQLMQQRTLKETSSRKHRENRRGQAKLYTDVNVKKRLDKRGADLEDRSSQFGNDDSISSKYLLGIFVRRANAGPWFFLRSLDPSALCTDSPALSVDPHSDSQIEVLQLGGLEAAGLRRELDALVALHIFGTGLGMPSLVNVVRQELPQLKRVKPRLIQFGYKTSFDEHVSILDRSMVMIERSLNDTVGHSSAQPSLAAKISLEAILAEKVSADDSSIPLREDLFASSNVKLLIDQINTFVEYLLASKTTPSVMVAADGSATFSGKECVQASAGVFIAPYETIESYERPARRESGRKGSSGSITESDRVEGPGEGFAIARAVERFLGEQPQEEGAEPRPADPVVLKLAQPASTSAPRLSLGISVAGIAGLMHTPLDAELIATVVAVAVARELQDRFLSRSTAAQQQQDRLTALQLDPRPLVDSDYQQEAPEALVSSPGSSTRQLSPLKAGELSKPPLDVVVLTDSRAVLKLTRKDPALSDPAVVHDERIDTSTLALGHSNHVKLEEASPNSNIDEIFGSGDSMPNRQILGALLRRLLHGAHPEGAEKFDEIKDSTPATRSGSIGRLEAASVIEIDQAEAAGSPTPTVQVKWAASHPERRELLSDRYVHQPPYIYVVPLT